MCLDPPLMKQFKGYAVVLLLSSRVFPPSCWIILVLWGSDSRDAQTPFIPHYSDTYDWLIWWISCSLFCVFSPSWQTHTPSIMCCAALLHVMDAPLFLLLLSHSHAYAAYIWWISHSTPFFAYFCITYTGAALPDLLFLICHWLTWWIGLLPVPLGNKWSVVLKGRMHWTGRLMLDESSGAITRFTEQIMKETQM